MLINGKCACHYHPETNTNKALGTLPGPTIEANWGDQITIHVTNKLKDNG